MSYNSLLCRGSKVSFWLSTESWLYYETPLLVYQTPHSALLFIIMEERPGQGSYRLIRLSIVMQMLPENLFLSLKGSQKCNRQQN